MAYSGKYRPKNIGKYEGDYNNVRYRSSWERAVFSWLDKNDQVKSWSSEEIIIKYICGTDGQLHRYFVDLKVTFKNGDVHLIEIKPKKETQEPKPAKRKTKRYITEVLTYVKNISKWEAAEQFCLDRGWTFSIWHEDIIKGMGIRLITG